MKKYITLAALLVAGSAFANAMSDDLKVPTAGNYFAGDFAFTFCIESLADLQSGGTLLAAYGNYTGNEYETNGFKVSSSGNGFSLQVGNGSLSGVANADADITPDSNYTFVSDATRYATTSSVLSFGSTYTVKNDGGDQKQIVSLYLNDILVETLSYNGNMGNGNENSTIWSVGNATYDVTPIPEPSAFGLLAGLGALALVGARRRRR